MKILQQLFFKIAEYFHAAGIPGYSSVTENLFERLNRKPGLPQKAAH
jgi:hypothetical protein